MLPTSAVASLRPLLQALADENRLRILDVLRAGESCVCDLQAELDMGQSLLSHHLGVLRQVGLVSDRREGRWVHYSLVAGALGDLEDFTSDLRRAAEDPPTRRNSCQVGADLRENETE